jgi:hypothetical protein
MAERITQRELIYRLERQDPDSFVLIVEGDDDLRFWSLLVPVSQRNRTMVYPVRTIDVVGADDGERGRALKLAEHFWGTPLQDRVLFLLDADYDRLTGRAHNANVVLTDFRDLEAYAYDLGAVECLLFAMREEPALARQVLAAFDLILRPCGYLRAADALNDLKLPFQRTCGDRLRRYIEGPRSNPRVELDRLIGALLQNNDQSLAEVPAVRARYDEANASFNAVASPDLIHGKDFVNAIAWRFGIGIAEAERALLGCLASTIDRIRGLPTIMQVEQFVRA